MCRGCRVGGQQTWIAVPIASSVDLVALQALMFVYSWWQVGNSVTLHQLLEALHNNGCEWYWVIVIQTVYHGVFRQWDYDRGLQARWGCGPGQGLIEDFGPANCSVQFFQVLFNIKLLSQVIRIQHHGQRHLGHTVLKTLLSLTS